MSLKLAPLKHSFFIIGLSHTFSSIFDRVEQHQKAVDNQQRYRDRCARCNSDCEFKRHDARERKVRVIVDLAVQVLLIALIRWRCANCRYVFTDHPPFLLPYRRYASSSLLPLADEYLHNDQQSYQKVVAPKGRVIGYVTPQGKPIDERAMHRSTLCRFVVWMGMQTAALQAGLQMLDEREPLANLHLFSGAVAPHKYRSEQRGQTLRNARRLLHLIDRWENTFDEPFFPPGTLWVATKARAP